MRFCCPFCYFTVSADESSRGSRVTCPSCGKNILVPAGRFENGCIVGDFIIKSKLGVGSIGAVYKAQQISLDRTVALKILSPQYTTKKGISDFLREARAAAKLIHTNLVQAYAVGEDDNVCYMAMTYVTGETLRSRLKREGHIPVDESLHIIQQVAEALHYAWTEAKMIHRDVKPDNIMLSENGIVKLTDLGLAMNQSEWTEDMEISGSPAYMSPEQFAGEKLDTRSDIYSLGITLYQMLSGRLPFDGATVKTLAKQHYEDDPVLLNKLDPSIPSRVVYLVKKMIAKTPNRRFKNMEELLKEIWNIRQVTAPARELVPEIHTISMKRLDYDIQQASVSARNRKRQEKIIDEKRRSMLVRIAAMLSGTIVFTAIIIAVSYTGKKIEHPVFSEIEDFARHASDARVSADTLAYQARKLYPEIDEAIRNKGENLRYAREYISYLVLKKQEEEQTVLLEEKDIRISELQAEIRKLKVAAAELDAKNETVKNLTASLEKNTKELEDVKNAKSTIESELERLKESFYRQQAEKHINTFMNAMLTASYAEAVNAANTAKNIKQYLAPAAPDVMESTAALCANIHTALTASRLKYATYKLPDLNGIVLNIDNGLVTYAELLEPKSVPWNKLSSSDVWSLLAGDTENFKDEAKTKSAYELMRMNFGKAYELDKKNPFIIPLAEQYMQSELKKIRAISLTGRKNHIAAAQNLLLKMQGLPNSETYKTLLEPYIKQ